MFQGRYGAKLITDDDYALTVVRYIAANPVQAGVCAVPEEWRWSSYAATAGLAPQPAFLTTRVLGWFGGPRRVPPFVDRRTRRGLPRGPAAADGSRADTRSRN